MHLEALLKQICRLFVALIGTDLIQMVDAFEEESHKAGLSQDQLYQLAARMTSEIPAGGSSSHLRPLILELFARLTSTSPNGKHVSRM